MYTYYTYIGLKASESICFDPVVYYMHYNNVIKYVFFLN